jgi:hypothetical protein
MPLAKNGGRGGERRWRGEGSAHDRAAANCRSPRRTFVPPPCHPLVPQVAPAGGFEPSWKGPLIAAVVIISFIISVMLFVTLASFKRQRLLLMETVVRPAGGGAWGLACPSARTP